MKKYNQKELKRILKEHKKWLDGKGGKRADFAMTDLSGMSLRGKDLRGAIFLEANLERADLSEANLQEASLRGANLKGANFRGADLRWASLQDAKLWRANLEKTDLREAKLDWADKRWANFSGAKIRNTTSINPDLYILKMQPPSTKLRAWKYLYNGKSPIQRAKYEVGKTYIEQDYSSDDREACDKGLNVATLEWCLRHSPTYKNEFIEVEFQAKDIIAIPFATDGKFRVKKFKVLRKISRELAEETINSFFEPYKIKK